MLDGHLGAVADELADPDREVLEVLDLVDVEPVDGQVGAGDPGADLVLVAVEVLELLAGVLALGDAQLELGELAAVPGAERVGLDDLDGVGAVVGVPVLDLVLAGLASSARRKSSCGPSSGGTSGAAAVGVSASSSSRGGHRGPAGCGGLREQLHQARRSRRGSCRGRSRRAARRCRAPRRAGRGRRRRSRTSRGCWPKRSTASSGMSLRPVRRPELGPAASVATSSAGVALRPASVITNPSGPLSAFDMARVWAIDRERVFLGVRQLRSSLVTIASADPTTRPSTVLASARASQPWPSLERPGPDDVGADAEHRAEGLPAVDQDVFVAADPHRHAALVERGLEGVGHAAGVVEDFDGVVGGGTGCGRARRVRARRSRSACGVHGWSSGSWSRVERPVRSRRRRGARGRRGSTGLRPSTSGPPTATNRRAGASEPVAVVVEQRRARPAGQLTWSPTRPQTLGVTA